MHWKLYTLFSLSVIVVCLSIVGISLLSTNHKTWDFSKTINVLPLFGYILAIIMAGSTLIFYKKLI